MTQYSAPIALSLSGKKFGLDCAAFPAAANAFFQLLQDDNRGDFFAQSSQAFEIRFVQDANAAPQSYSISRQDNVFTLTASDQPGAFYGLIEFLDSLSPDGDFCLKTASSTPDFPERSITYEMLLDSENYSIEHAKTIIRRLAKNKMNAFHLGFIEHLLSFKNIQGLPAEMQVAVDKQQLDNINLIIDYAAQFFIDCFAHYRVFTLPKNILSAFGEISGTGTAFCPSSEKLWDIFEQTISEIPQIMPKLKGLAVLFSEGSGNFFECACQKCENKHSSDHILAASARLERALGAGYTPMVRTYLSGWRNIYEEPWFGTLQGKVSKNLWMHTNVMRSDQFLPHPPNLLIGKFENQIIDIDIFGEYFGWGQIPCCMADYLSQNLALLHKNKVKSVNGRIAWVFNTTSFDTHSQLNFHAFCKMAWNKETDSRQCVVEYCAQNFGAAGAQKLADMYMRTFEASMKTFYMDGMNINSHSRPAENVRRFMYLKTDFSAEFYDDGPQRAAETRENFEKWFNEKDQAVNIARQLFEESKTLYGLLAPEDARYFENTYGEMLQTAKVWNFTTKAVLSFRMYQLEQSELKKDDIKQQVLMYMKRGESQAWRAINCDPGYAFGIFNDIRMQLSEGLDPWSGYAPTGGKKKKDAGNVHEFSGVGGAIKI